MRQSLGIARRRSGVRSAMTAAALLGLLGAAAAGAAEPAAAGGGEPAAAPGGAAAPAAAAGEKPEGPDDAPPACGGGDADRAPDPRCGEPLDGRAPPADGGFSPARAALWLPRGLTKVALWPVVETTDLIETKHIHNWMDAWLTTDDGRVGVRPLFSYSTSFIASLGARFFFRRFPGEGTEVGARFLTGGAQVLFAQLELRLPTWTGLQMTATFDRRPDRLFAAVGPNSTETLTAAGLGIARYGSDIMRGNVYWSHRITGPLFATARGDVDSRNYQADQIRGGPSVSTLYGLSAADCAAQGRSAPCVNEAYLPRFYQGLRLLHAGGGFTVDWRSHARDGSGVTASAEAVLGQGLGSDPTEEVRWTGETVAAIGGTDRQLLLRARAATVSSLGSAPIPFDELVSPSGNLGMRGFPDGRFRGESGALATAEYRYFIAASLDATLFADVGTVAGPGFAGLTASHWFPDFGGGLRFYAPFGRYWEVPPRFGFQVAYAFDGGLRFILALAAF